MRRVFGVILFDLWRYLKALGGGGLEWVQIRNRNESLSPAPDGIGVRCDWRWTSDLHAPKVFPWLGLRLMRRALVDYPVVLSKNGEAPALSDKPDVSFVIGHRGKERLPHLLRTLRSIAAQRDTLVECIVVEQSSESQIKNDLPDWVRYVHTPPIDSAMPYSRSWTLNVGARLARGSLLVLHDNDMLVPQDYAANLLEYKKQGHEVLNLKRFIFYLSQKHTERILERGELMLDEAPRMIVQNLEAGGSVAITRDAFFAIGGFDEEFVGWGGEDNEFWARAQTLKVYPYGYLPIIHLWHPAQPGKAQVQGMGRETAELFQRRMAIPVEQCIAELKARDFGNPTKLDPPYVVPKIASPLRGSQ